MTPSHVLRRLTIDDLDGPSGTQLHQELNNLQNQLSLTGDHLHVPINILRKALQWPATYIFVAIIDGNVVGMITISFYLQLTEKVGTINSFVVDQTVRHLGIGRKLWRMMFVTAKEEEATLLDLTSRKERQAARAFYLRNGFEICSTDLFELKLR